MSPARRLFVAIELSRQVRETVRERQRQLRSSLPPARWVDPGQAHLTLLFLGDTEAQVQARLEAALRRAVSATPPFLLQLVGGGTFPPRRPARVAWVGVTAPAVLRELQSAVAEVGCREAGLERERRPYHPHITLARCRAPWARSDVDRFEGMTQGAWGEEVTVDEVVLFASELGPSGARHTAVARCALGGAR